jgi:hypothetical protein
MISKLELKHEDYVWKKGFENWKKIKDVTELRSNVIAELPVIEKDIPLSSLDPNEKSLFIRIGIDRGTVQNDYGPYSLNILKQLFKENRINGKTFVLIKGMKDFKILADFLDYQEIFNELPPVIKDVDRRSNQRKPFVARLFVENNKKVYEGICRDISVGGMQVLMDDFQGKAGEMISINVHPDNSEYHFTAAGQVVRILEGNSGFSFRFENLSEEAKNAIDMYLKKN